MPLQADKKQVGVAIELVAGVKAAAVDTAAASKLVTTDASINIEPEFIEATGSKEGLTNAKKSVGKETGNAEVTFELKGTNDGTGTPAWEPFFRSCGFAAVDFLEMEGVIANGPFRHLETIEQATSGATATVIKDAFAGDQKLYVFGVSGTPTATAVWTGESTGATMTPTTVPTAAGRGYYPISKATKRLDLSATATPFDSGQLFAGKTSGARGVYIGLLSGGIEFDPVRGTFADGETIEAIGATGNYVAGDGSATVDTPSNETFVNFPTLSQKVNEDGVAVTLTAARANLAFNFTAGQATTVTASSQGIVDSVDDAMFLTGVAQDNRSAPKWEGAAMAVRDGEAASPLGALGAQTPCLANLSIDMGLNLVDRVCASAPGGVEEKLASSRTPTGSFDPEATLEADIPWLKTLRAGDLMHFETSLGTEDGNRFSFSMPGLQFTAASSGDRENILTRDLSFDLTGGNLYNATQGGAVGTQGNDNEIVMLWHRA